MDTFPYESWAEAAAAAQESGEGFFTFGDGGAFILVLLMIAVTIVTIVAGVVVEGRKLDEQAARLRGSAGGED